MEPNIIQMNELFIAGLTGNVTETEKVWNEIELQFDKNPFQKNDDNIYKIHFLDGINNVNPQKEIHVGYLVENCNVIDNFQPNIQHEFLFEDLHYLYHQENEFYKYYHHFFGMDFYQIVIQFHSILFQFL